MNMKFIIYHQAYRFEEKIEKFLIEKEDIYSLFYGVLQAIKAGKYERPLMATIEENHQVLAIIQMTPPHPLNLIIVNEQRTEEVIEFLIKSLMDEEIGCHSMISLKHWAYAFAEKWKKRTGMGHTLLMDQGLYRLNQVNETLESSPGNWRFATEADAPQIEKWFNLFEEDTGMPITSTEQVKQRVAQFLKEREVFLWEHEGSVVSMMKKSRPTKNGITVSLVFTPKEERKKGYARTLVAAGSKELLRTYDFCVLYTDMMNPTSNKIYQEIGYEKIADSVHVAFVEDKS